MGAAGGRGGATEAKMDQTIAKIRSKVRIVLLEEGGRGGGRCSTEEKVNQTTEMYFALSA